MTGSDGSSHTVLAPFAGIVVAIPHGSEEPVVADTAVVVLEAMKMEHEVLAGADGVVQRLAVAIGDEVEAGQPLLTLAPGSVEPLSAPDAGEQAGDAERPDLAEVHARHAIGLDAARGEAVARRRERGRRTARENIADLLDPGTFVEYGPLLFAAQ